MRSGIVRSEDLGPKFYKFLHIQALSRRAEPSNFNCASVGHKVVGISFQQLDCRRFTVPALGTCLSSIRFFANRIAAILSSFRSDHKAQRNGTNRSTSVT